MIPNKIALQNEFFRIFDSMNRIYKNGDEYMAINCARAISDYIKSGVVYDSSVIGIPSGTYHTSYYTYKGSATGTLQINEGNLKNLLYNTFLTYKNDYDIAMNVSHNIHVCCIQAYCDLSTSGFVFEGGTSIQPESGNGSGGFISFENVLYTKLIACYNTMRSMTSNGNVYHAQELSSAIDTYLKSGSISTSYTLTQWGTPFGSANGQGGWRNIGL